MNSSTCSRSRPASDPSDVAAVLTASAVPVVACVSAVIDVTLAEASLVRSAASCVFRAISRIAEILLFHTDRNRTRHVVNLIHSAADLLDRLHRILSHATHRSDLLADLLGRPSGLVRQRFDLRRHHGKALAQLARPRRFDRCVQRQQVCLRRDVADQADNLADLARALRQPPHGFIGFLRLRHSAPADLRGLSHLTSNLTDRRTQFLRRGRNPGNILRSLTRGTFRIAHTFRATFSNMDHLFSGMIHLT